MPDIQEKKWKLVAQGGEKHGEGSHVDAGKEGQQAEGAHGGEHAGAAHGEHEGGGNPLTHHHPLQYSASGLVIALLLVALALAAGRNLAKIPRTRFQSLVELTVEFFRDFCRQGIGPGGEKYAPFIGTLFLFILFSNLSGALPLMWNREGASIGPALFVSPMANISMTFALAIIVFFTVQVVAFRSQGFIGRIKHLAGPVWWLSWLILPLELFGELVRPLSLSLRLFGNIFGEETIVAVLVTLLVGLGPIGLIPLHLPIVIFGLLTALVQAAVFCLLTCVYLQLARETHDHEHHEGDAPHGMHEAGETKTEAAFADAAREMAH